LGGNLAKPGAVPGGSGSFGPVMIAKAVFAIPDNTEMRTVLPEFSWRQDFSCLLHGRIVGCGSRANQHWLGGGFSEPVTP